MTDTQIGLSGTPEKGKIVGYKYSTSLPPDFLHPAFCFRHLDKKLGFPEDKKQRNHIINTLEKLGKMTWGDIHRSRYKNGLGYEKMDWLDSRSPMTLPKDAHVIGFYCSSGGRMIGYRDMKILYVFWFDWSPFKMYKH